MRLTVAWVAAAGLSACTDYSRVHKELQDVQAQLSQVTTDVSAMRTSLDEATEATRQAAQKAAAATSTANQALYMAQTGQDALARLDEKLDQLDKAKARKPVRKAKQDSDGQPPGPAGTPPK
jgi:methyl-accepting chemotaxis protein